MCFIIYFILGNIASLTL